MSTGSSMSKLIAAVIHEPQTVADIMTANPIALNEEDNLAVLQEEMQNIGLRHMPVVDGRKLVGLVTHRDLLAHTVGALHKSKLIGSIDAHDKRTAFVADIMTRDVRTARLDTSIGQAAAWMATGRFGCLPVVDAEGALLGIVCESDLAKLIASHWSGESR